MVKPPKKPLESPASRLGKITEIERLREQNRAMRRKLAARNKAVAAMIVVAYSEGERARQAERQVKQVKRKAAIDLKQAHLAARTDQLTGIPNRRQLDEEMAKAIGQGESGTSFAVLLIDIDKFKVFNDTKGHVAGDKVLASVAQTLKAKCRVEDTTGRLADEGQARSSTKDSALAARYGGEEFGVILIGCGHEGAIIKAERLRMAVENNSVDIGNEKAKVTITVGVTMFKPGDAAKAIWERADQALYAGKSYGGEGGGRNRVVFFDGQTTDFPERGVRHRSLAKIEPSGRRRGPNNAPGGST